MIYYEELIRKRKKEEGGEIVRGKEPIINKDDIGGDNSGNAPGLSLPAHRNFEQIIVFNKNHRGGEEFISV